MNISLLLHIKLINMYKRKKLVKQCCFYVYREKFKPILIKLSIIKVVTYQNDSS